MKKFDLLEDVLIPVIVAIAIMFAAFSPNFAWAETSEEAHNCMTMNVYHEARGESIQGQLAVAQVTMNRVDHPDWPNTVCGVVWQSKQFSWTHDGRSDKMHDKAAIKKARKVAQLAIGGLAWLEDVGFSNHYHADYVSPWWAECMEKRAVIGRHIFLQD